MNFLKKGKIKEHFVRKLLIGHTHKIDCCTEVVDGCFVAILCQIYWYWEHLLTDSLHDQSSAALSK